MQNQAGGVLITSGLITTSDSTTNNAESETSTSSSILRSMNGIILLLIRSCYKVVTIAIKIQKRTVIITKKDLVET